MSSKPKSLFSLVLIPTILTLVVTIVRLLGELNGWSPDLFGTSAGGRVDNTEEAMPSLFGISMLVPIFGLWFGFKLRRSTGQPAKLGRAALLTVIGIAVAVGGIVLLAILDLFTMPDKANPGEPRGIEWFLALSGVAAILTFVAWPRLAGTLLVYGLLARIPVVVITLLAINQEDWDTHYTKLPEEFVVPEDGKLAALITPQLTFWIAFTIVCGTLFGCLGAAVAGKRKD